MKRRKQKKKNYLQILAIIKRKCLNVITLIKKEKGSLALKP